MITHSTPATQQSTQQANVGNSRQKMPRPDRFSGRAEVLVSVGTWSGGPVGGHPQHVGDTFANVGSFPAMEIHVPPRVIKGGDDETGQVARDQLEHEKA